MALVDGAGGVSCCACNCAEIAEQIMAMVKKAKIRLTLPLRTWRLLRSLAIRISRNAGNLFGLTRRA